MNVSLQSLYTYAYESVCISLGLSVEARVTNAIRRGFKSLNALPQTPSSNIERFAIFGTLGFHFFPLFLSPVRAQTSSKALTARIYVFACSEYTHFPSVCTDANSCFAKHTLTSSLFFTLTMFKIKIIRYVYTYIQCIEREK